MSSITVAQIAAAARTARDCFVAAEDQLNAADARLGDGDTGAMLKRLVVKVAEVDFSNVAEPAEALRTMAMAASASTGSSLGTLIMASLLAASNAIRTKTETPPSLAQLLEIARDTMLARGGAKPEDKTVIDSLSAVAAALTAAPDEPAAPVAAHAAAEALLRFRDQPNRMGRARLYGERSRGLDDPGMLAFALLCAALAGMAPPAP